MIKKKYVCDLCGEEIEEKKVALIKMTEGYYNRKEHYEFQLKNGSSISMDVCPYCLERAKRMFDSSEIDKSYCEVFCKGGNK